jgi:lipopolysaccharide transport system permease protein
MVDTQPAVDYPRTRIRPAEGWSALHGRELWNYRELLLFLAWRDISVRYKQTVLGAAWAIIQPFFTMLVFYVFLGKLAQVPSDGVPYPLFAYTALVPWTFFANGLQESSNSLVGNSNLITKVYFPRLVIPMAAVSSGIVDFVLAFVVLLGMMLAYGRLPTINVIWLPFFIALALGAALGVGLWLSALNVQFRDVRYVVPFLVQFWLFATPVAYPSSIVPEPWHTLYGINPMVGVVEGFRWALLSGSYASPVTTWSLNRMQPLGVLAGPLPLPLILTSVVAVVVLVLSGALYFQRAESTFADVV